MTTLTLTSVDLSAGPRTLVSGLDLVAADGDVTAVVGVNGAGKTTLLRTLAGELAPAAGTVRLAPPGATVGYLPQVTPDAGDTLLDYVRRRTGVAAADLELEVASDGLAAAAPGATDRYDAALERWLDLGAADLSDRLAAAAASVGLEVDLDRPLGSLSGGQSARAALVAVLLSRYDVLLLDEPTNDLDERGRGAVVDFVRAHPGPVVVASHDRTFLDEVATSVVELDLAQGRVGHSSGGWSAYREARELDRRQAVVAFEQYADARDALTTQARQRAEWAARGRRGVAQGDEPDKHQREKFRARADRQGAKGARLRAAADRLEVVEQPRKEWELRYRITAGSPSADVVATLSGAVVSRGPFRLGPVDLTLARGDRVWLDGLNGSGKTTLLAALLGTTPLAGGRRSLGTRVRVGVLDQVRSLLDTDDSVADVVTRELGPVERDEVRTLLAKFGLGPDHADRPARTLSLGERTRALMALFQGRSVNVLVLDEPTNHLDVPAVEQLEAAVRDFDATLLVVSHDRAFVEACRPSVRWVVEAGRVAVFPR